MATLIRTGTVAERPAGGDGEPDGLDPRLRERLRVVLCCSFLVLLATATRPGRIIADTKIDMALNPVGFLDRALHLWDIEQFGQLQNQVSGYLFPMGPFFVLGHLLGMPAWIVQRFWLAALMCTAFLGTRRLAARLGIGTPRTRLIGGLAYALSAHGLAALGTNSSEYLPLAMIPWITLPLVTAARGGGRVRAAARSGLAVACCGGINGTATLAALAVPVLFVLTRPRGAPRIRVLGWWGTAVVFGTAWWSVPLLLLGRYAFSFLPYTENAATTTATTGPANVLRGAERWIDFLVVDGRAWWPLGHALATEAVPVVCTGAVTALGLAGLVRARLPERTFLVVTLLTGLAVMVAGHAGPLAAETRHLIDGPLAPMRNLYKFDGLVRLPLALGIAHLLSAVPDPRSAAAAAHPVTAVASPATAARRASAAPRAGATAPRRRLPWATVAVALALAGLALPALGNGLAADGDFGGVPRYWRDAAAWLNSRAGQQGVIAVPGARFGEYLWGRPMDEVMQPLLRVRWGERQLVPAGSAGFTRLVGAIDDRITSGHGSAGLTEVLARMGVRYLLVRNDLRRADLRGAWPARVHQALDTSPGIHRVAWFGGVPAGSTWPDDAMNTLDQPYPPVEIYEVDGAGDAVNLVDADRALRLYGSPEALLTMADNGLLDGRPVLLDGDAPGTGDPPGRRDAPGTSARPVVSDALRKVRRNFGELRGQTSPTLTAADEAGVPASKRDILDSGWARYSTVASYSGVSAVTASSSASDVNSIAELDQPGGLPYAAVDGNPWTRWETGGWDGPVGQWLKVGFDKPLTPRHVTASFAQDSSLGPPPARIAVETERGRIVQNLARTSSAQPLRVPAGPTRWLRIRIMSLAWQPSSPVSARVALAELHVDGVHAVRHYRLPDVPAGGTVVMSRAPGGLPACMKGSVRWVCAPSLERQDEEPYGFDRVFPMARAAAAKLSGTATITDAATIQRYTSTDPRLSVTASSTLTRDPASLPRSAFDGDPTTTWVPGTADHAPWLSLSWGRKIRVGHLTVRRPPGASQLTQVRVEGDGDQWREVTLGASGRLSFTPMRTGSLTLRFTGTPQITDVTVPGVRPFRSPPGAKVRLPCGGGPRVRLNGRLVPTRATGTYADLLAGRPLRFTACRKVKVRGGDNELAPAPFDVFRIDSAVITPPGGLGPAPKQAPAPVTVTRWTSEHRQVEVHAEHASYLVVNENYNAGWQATIDGRTLRAVRLDGWRQAWALPAGTAGTVKLSYRPDLTYGAAVLLGLNFLLVLVIAALWPARSRPGPAVRERRPPGRVLRVLARAGAVVAAAGLGYWMGGPGAAALTGGLAAVFAWLPGRLRAWAGAPGLPAAAMLAATASLAVGYQLTALRNGYAGVFSGTVPLLCCLLIVARLAVAVPDGTRDRPDRPDQRNRQDQRDRTNRQDRLDQRSRQDRQDQPDQAAP